MVLEWTEAEAVEIERLVKKYPRKDAALLPVLHLAQRKLGHLSPEAQLLVASTLSVPAVRVREVVTFYEMFHEHPEGQVQLELCTNIACHLLGADALMEHLKRRLGVEVGHQTEDGVFGLRETECLASCGSGPCMRVGNDYYEHLSVEAVDALLDVLKTRAKALSGEVYVQGPSGPHVGPVRGFQPASRDLTGRKTEGRDTAGRDTAGRAPEPRGEEAASEVESPAASAIQDGQSRILGEG